MVEESDSLFFAESVHEAFVTPNATFWGVVSFLESLVDCSLDANVCNASVPCLAPCSDVSTCLVLIVDCPLLCFDPLFDCFPLHDDPPFFLPVLLEVRLEATSLIMASQL